MPLQSIPEYISIHIMLKITYNIPNHPLLIDLQLIPISTSVIPLYYSLPIIEVLSSGVQFLIAKEQNIVFIVCVSDKCDYSCKCPI